MSVNSKSTSNPKEQEQRFLSNQEDILYELRGIFNSIESISRTILDTIQLISPGGGLYEAQQRANAGLEDFKKSIETAKKYSYNSNSNDTR